MHPAAHSEVTKANAASPAAYARFLRELAEDDHAERGAREDLDGADCVGEAVSVVVVVEAGRAGRGTGSAGGRGWDESRCTHVSMVERPPLDYVGLGSEPAEPPSHPQVQPTRNTRAVRAP